MTHLDPFNPMPPRDDIHREHKPLPKDEASFGWAGALLLLLGLLIVVGLAAA